MRLTARGLSRANPLPSLLALLATSAVVPPRAASAAAVVSHISPTSPTGLAVAAAAAAPEEEAAAVIGGPTPLQVPGVNQAQTLSGSTPPLCIDTSPGPTAATPRAPAGAAQTNQRPWNGGTALTTPLHSAQLAGVVTCYTCVNVPDNVICNRYAIDRPCPAGKDFCHTLHILDSKGRSVLVNKKCADADECEPRSVGCLIIDMQTVCASCCDEMYCNETVPSNETTVFYNRTRVPTTPFAGVSSAAYSSTVLGSVAAFCLFLTVMVRGASCHFTAAGTSL